MSTHIDARVGEVFGQLPFLISFSLDRELALCDIELDTWPGCPWSERDYGEIDGMLPDLIGARCRHHFVPRRTDFDNSPKKPISRHIHANWRFDDEWT